MKFGMLFRSENVFSSYCTRECVPWSAHTCLGADSRVSGDCQPLSTQKPQVPPGLPFCTLIVGQALLGAFTSSFHLIALMGVYN